LIADLDVARVKLYGTRYELDLAACRQKLLERAVELGAGPRKGGMKLIAEAAGVHYMTVYRFFDGSRPLETDSIIAIVTRGLGLRLNDVAKVA
jgi:AcrR family transcriptional regulator